MTFLHAIHSTARSHQLWLCVLVVGAIITMMVSASVGAVDIPLSTQLSLWLELISIPPASAPHSMEYSVFWNIRMPRMLLGCLIGGALALSGATMQGLFRNPLADPGLIGVSGGGALAVVGLIVFGGPLFAILPSGVASSIYLTPVAAFVGAMLTVWLVMTLSQRHGRTDMATMLLAGVAINALVGALIGFATYMADDKQLRNLTLWSLGSLSGATWRQVAIVALTTIPSSVWLWRQAQSLNLMLLGQREASHLGVDVHALRRRCIAVAALIVAVGVGFVGVIGFVGLVVPHLARLSRGPDHRWVMPASLLFGSILLTIADVVARIIVAPAELPIGIVTSALGAPFFVWLLWQRRQGGI